MKLPRILIFASVGRAALSGAFFETGTTAEVLVTNVDVQLLQTEFRVETSTPEVVPSVAEGRRAATTVSGHPASDVDVSGELEYAVTVEELVPPLVSQEKGTSDFFMNLNPAWLPLHGHDNGEEALMVRVQNCSKPPCKQFDVEDRADGDWSTLGPSYLALLHGKGDSRTFSHADDSAIVFGPKQAGEDAAYGVEDPRIVYRHEDSLYYMTYTTASSPGVKESYLATASDPAGPWTVQTHFPDAPGGTALLLRDDVGPPHYAFATDNEKAGSLQIFTSMDLRSWNSTGKTLMQGRLGQWDQEGVAAGPAPERLSDGSYVFFYPTDNGWAILDPPLGRCALGWAILDGNDPTRIVARSSEPLLVATQPYESHGFTPAVIFTTGLKRLDKDEFLLYYGAADTAVAAARVQVRVPGM